MSMGIQILFSHQERPYTGVELRPHFLLTELGLKGSGLAAFMGPCQVRTEHLVDWEDRLAQDRIEARKMIHFMGEFFGVTLREGVLRQRLLIASIAESLPGVRREGNDLFKGDRKLSVSIVTASPVSLLLHLGINIDPTGAPVPAIGLLELGLSSEDISEKWAPAILQRFATEWESVDWACAKVRPVI